MSDVENILDRSEGVSRQQVVDEITNTPNSTEYAKFREVAINLEPGGETVKCPRLTKNQVSSIRRQVNHLNPECNKEKEFIATRRKMKTEDGEDLTNEEGEQLYTLHIRRDEVDR